MPWNCIVQLSIQIRENCKILPVVWVFKWVNYRTKNSFIYNVLYINSSLSISFPFFPYSERFGLDIARRHYILSLASLSSKPNFFKPFVTVFFHVFLVAFRLTITIWSCSNVIFVSTLLISRISVFIPHFV